MVDLAESAGNVTPEQKEAAKMPTNRHVETVVVNGDKYEMTIDQKLYEAMQEAKVKEVDKARENREKQEENAKKYDPFNSLEAKLKLAMAAVGKDVMDEKDIQAFKDFYNQMQQYLPDRIEEQRAGRVEGYVDLAAIMKKQNYIGDLQLSIIQQQEAELNEFLKGMRAIGKKLIKPRLNDKDEVIGYDEDDSAIQANAPEIRKFLDWLANKGTMSWKERRRVPRGALYNPRTGKLEKEGDPDNIEITDIDRSVEKTHLDQVYTLVKGNLIDFTHEFNDISNPSSFESSVNMMMNSSQNDLFTQGGQYELLQFNAEKRRYEVNFEHLTLWVRDQMWYWSDLMDDDNIDLWQMIRFDTTFRAITLFELLAYDPGKYFKTKYASDEDSKNLQKKYGEYRNFLITLVSPSTHCHNLGVEHIKVRNNSKAFGEQHWEKIGTNELFFNSRWLRLMNSFSAKEIARIFDEGEKTGDFSLNVYNPENGTAGKGFKDALSFFDNIRELSDGNLSFEAHDAARAEAIRLEKAGQHDASMEKEGEMNAIWDTLGQDGRSTFAQALAGDVIKNEFRNLNLIFDDGKTPINMDMFSNETGQAFFTKLIKNVKENKNGSAREAILQVMKQQLTDYVDPNTITPATPGGVRGVSLSMLDYALDHDLGRFLQYALNMKKNQKYKQGSMNIYTDYGTDPRGKKNIILQALETALVEKSRVDDEKEEAAHKASGSKEPYQQRRMNDIEARLAIELMYYTSFWTLVGAKNDKSLTGDNYPARLIHSMEFLSKNYHHNTMGRPENYAIIANMPTMLDGLKIEVDRKYEGAYGLDKIKREEVTMSEYLRGKSRLIEENDAIHMIRSEFPELGAHQYLSPMKYYMQWFDLVRKSADVIDLSNATLSPDAYGNITMNWKEVQKYHELWNILRELFEKHAFLYDHYTRVWQPEILQKDGVMKYENAKTVFKTMKMYEYLFGEPVQRTLKAFRDIDNREAATKGQAGKGTIEEKAPDSKEIEQAVEAAYHGATTHMFTHPSSGMPQWGPIERLNQQMAALMDIPMGIEWYRDSKGVLRSRPVGDKKKYSREKVRYILETLGDVNLTQRAWIYVGGETGSVSWSILSAFFQEFFKHAMKSVFEG